MIRSIQLCFTHARQLGGKREFRFEPGINVVAGSNGSGKSTLRRALHECEECRKDHEGDVGIPSVNSERSNPHSR